MVVISDLDFSSTSGGDSTGSCIISWPSTCSMGTSHSRSGLDFNSPLKRHSLRQRGVRGGVEWN